MDTLTFSTSKFLIPSSTGEYLPTDIHTIYSCSGLSETNEELFELLQDNEIEILYSISADEAHQAYNELLNKLKELLQSDYIGDDDFFDYIPDWLIRYSISSFTAITTSLKTHYLQGISKNLFRSSITKGLRKTNSLTNATSYIFI